jgi:hypothetical protein
VVKIGSGEVDEGGSKEEVKSVDRAMLYRYLLKKDSGKVQVCNHRSFSFLPTYVPAA